jgi:hypothetical protein
MIVSKRNRLLISAPWSEPIGLVLRRAFRAGLALAAGCAIVALMLTAPAIGEESESSSREEEQAHLQAQKAKALTPLAGNKAERILDIIERTGMLGTVPRGFYPWVGSVLGGGGVGVGGGYRFGFADDASANFLAGWSFKNYKLLQATLTLPTLTHGRVHSGIDAKWIDAPRVSFYGIGNDSNKELKTTYLYRPTKIGGTLGVSLTKWLSIGGGGDFLNVQTGPGEFGTSIEEIFTTATAPGLGTQINYGVARATAVVDWRSSPGYTRRGGVYSFEWANYRQLDGSNYSYRQFDADLQQFIPLLRENWVMVFRAATSMTDTSGANQVPYFMMPYLGSGETLRAFQNRRFRDRNSLLLQAEYRWTPAHFVDMALFADTGKVASKRSDLNLDGLHTDYGIGIRFHGFRRNVLRIDLAHGNEGFNLIFSTGIF